MAAPRFLQDLPIRQKLRAIVLIISGVALAGAFGLFVTYQWFSSLDQGAQRLGVMADVVGSQAVAALEFEQESEAVAILNSLRAEPLILSAAVYRRDGRVFATYLRNGADKGLIP